MILAGDIGGTKTHLGFFDAVDGRPRLARSTVFQSGQYSGLADIISEFIASKDVKVSAAAFGVAGPVSKGRVVTTNLPWVVVEADLSKLLGIPDVRLLNDLESVAFGVGLLTADELAVLNKGREQEGNAGIVAAGTGLGIAGLFWDGKSHVPSASEGGHVDFAPRNDIEVDLLRFLLRRHTHVSVERLVSGPGLFSIYEFLKERESTGKEDPLSERIENEDPSQVIASAALSGESPRAVQALDLFTSIYGATAGNLALTLMATGGIYIGGGIAPKVLPKLMDGTFLNAYLDKGRFRKVLEDIPVKVILNPHTGLLGAARVAAAAS